MFSLGATLFILSDHGTDPLDVFCLGIKQHFDLKIGTIQSSFALVCLAFWALIEKKTPPITTFLTFFFCGYLIDFFWYSLDFLSSYNQYWIWFILMAMILCVQGSAFILMSGFGVRAMDLIAISLHQKTGKPFWLFKGILEFFLLDVGYMLGGPVGTGTMCFFICVGWLIQPTIIFNQKLIPNYGDIS